MEETEGSSTNYLHERGIIIFLGILFEIFEVYVCILKKGSGIKAWQILILWQSSSLNESAIIGH